MLPPVAVTSTTNPSGHRRRRRLRRVVEFMLNLTSKIVAVLENFDWTSVLNLRSIVPLLFDT
jgi:hypothetical protein